MRSTRERVFDRDGRKCRRCPSVENLHIDHILPKAKYPHLMFEISNLQVLCRNCNFRKQREEDYKILKPSVLIKNGFMN